MGQTTFTRTEAEAKVGTQVRTRVAFAWVPQGAIDPPSARAETVSRPTRAKPLTRGVGGRLAASVRQGLLEPLRQLSPNTDALAADQD